ncbi:AraC family transcriptional regulator [Actinoplanes cyaneus]|uniref:AraC family transcriptional regulator n=1 Tax=Actinoplanes cyaneus TaxID=52696 RepID=A0A919IQU3_9ACTN|nr:AraC family transcriptional regulator [Actinoplanes cyaneus]MCW2138174.1 transcriptional regulator, AraC family [Actinoplanes cyaneus]GID70530.1 AraC family transcriptional regulator [Actinoplanes cyaneus]
MDDSSEKAVLRAIDAMRERMGEQLTVDELARTAMFSKFHFTRLFQRSTGVSPGRFLSALRLQRAKELLLTTSMNVADISVQVGYNSVGTFSSRFSRSVGMSPTTYRRHAGFAPSIRPVRRSHSARPSDARMAVRLRVSEPAGDALIFVGVFPERIPEGQPAQCAVVAGGGRVLLDQVPAGTWYLLAQSVLEDADAEPVIAVATYGPVTVRAGSLIRADLVLKPSRALDPPVLMALTDARKHALSRMRDSYSALAEQATVA